jgi:DNA replication protein DnaC
MSLPNRLDDCLKFAGLTPLHRELYTFSSFEITPGNKRAFDLCVGFSQGKSEHYFLTLMGGCGLGKTHLAIAAIIEIMEKCGDKVCFYSQTERLLDMLRSKFNNNTENDHDTFEIWFNFVKNIRYLVLDDLGAQHDTHWAQAKLEELVDYRYFYQKATIFTTNLSINEMPARIGSRLMSGINVICSGQDFRVIQTERRLTK